MVALVSLVSVVYTVQSVSGSFPTAAVAREVNELKATPAGHATRAHLRPPSFSEHVCEVLRADIQTGRLPEGTRITEAFAMERTGVSRTPVREGLRRIEAEGLIVSHRGRGAFVSYRLTGAEALLVYDVRLVLEPRLTRLAAERMTREELAVIKGVLDEFVAAIDSADPREVGQLDADFHMAIYEASGSELLNVLRGYWSRIQLELSERVYTAELPKGFVREHLGIMEALEAAQPLLAEQRMAAHIEHGRKTFARSLDDASQRAESQSASAARRGGPLTQQQAS